MMTRNRQAFTLIELLVVMSIIALLIALLLPALQATRGAARKIACLNNLRQIGFALHNYETQIGRYPASWRPVAPNASGNINGWSAQAQLLPFLEEASTSSEINYNLDFSNVNVVVTADGVSRRISALRVPVYLCPSEVRDEVRFSGGIAKHYPINYAVNCGVWFVWNPATGQGGAGAFFPASRLTPADFRDGHSHTVAFGEVKGWTPYYRNAALTPPTAPTTPAKFCGLGGALKTSSGHTKWVDGRVHQIGFTSFFTPNTPTLCSVSGVQYDVDWTNQQEGKSATVSTYAIVTSRSYHPGIVNVLMMDSSVRTIENDVNLGVWRAISTRKGKEILPDYFDK